MGSDWEARGAVGQDELSCSHGTPVSLRFGICLMPYLLPVKICSPNADMPKSCCTFGNDQPQKVCLLPVVRLFLY